MKNTILSLESQQALEFFLEHENYFDVQLPIYFNTSKLLHEISKITIKNPQLLFDKITSDNTHLILYTQKPNGEKRPLTMVNPVLYVILAKKLTEKDIWRNFIHLFDFYKEQDKISCSSIPIVSSYRKFKKYKAKQIMNWYDNFEQYSVKLSLRYDYMAITDIQNFYPSITKQTLTKSLSTSKNNNPNEFIELCNKFLDTYTEKGLPQGNNFFHLLADTVLLNVDKTLYKKIKNYNIEDYKILRYRDDYRIFANNEKDANIILTLLKEVLYSLGLQHNENKTGIYDDIITNSIKTDKQAWLKHEILIKNNTQPIATDKILLIIKEYSKTHPNTSGVQRGLNIVYKKLKKVISFADKNRIPQIIAIIIDIAKTNPRWAANCLQILDILSFKIKDTQQEELAKILHKKLIHAHTDFSVILWVQRFIYGIDNSLFNLSFDGYLSQYISHKNNHQLWDFSFTKNKSLQKAINNPIIDFQLIDNEHQTLSHQEVDLFCKFTTNPE